MQVLEDVMGKAPYFVRSGASWLLAFLPDDCVLHAMQF